MKIIDITFIPHCDEEYCTMGSAEFECPYCGKWTVDYGDVWLNFYDNVIEEAEAECEHCDREILLHQRKGKDGYEFFIY